MKSSKLLIGLLLSLGWVACRTTSTEPPQEPVRRVITVDSVHPVSNSVAIYPHAQSISTVDTLSFSASAFSLPVNYSWDFGDGVALNSSERTARHYFQNDGTYHVCLTAENNGKVLARDTAWVTVSYPTTNCNEFCNRLFVTSSLFDSTGERYSVTLPIKNSDDYSFILQGLTFDSRFDHRAVTTSATGYFDTIARRNIVGTLSGNGRYLLNTYTSAFDSSYARLLPTKYNNRIHFQYRSAFRGYDADSLRLIRLSCDSLIFEGCQKVMPRTEDYQRDIDSSSCAQTDIIPISLYRSYLPPARVRIVFWRLR